MLEYENEEKEVLVCQVIATFGDGVNDLDGTGGEFEFTMMLDSQVNQPDPQLVWFSTATRATVFVEQFVLPVGATVYVKVKSPNAADSSVWVRACIYEVGIYAIRDDLLEILVNQRGGASVIDASGGTGGGQTTGGSTVGGGTGVYPGNC